MSHAKHSRALAQLREVCALAETLPSRLWMPTLLEALHTLVPSQRNLFDWCDGAGRLTHYCIEGPVDARIAKLYFDAFHNSRELDAMPGFAQALQSGAQMLSAQQLNQPAFFRSALFHEIWRPQGLRYRTELIPRDALGRPLGSLVLYRGSEDRCFSPLEESLLLPLLPHLARALSRAVPAPASDSDWVPSGDATETLLLDHEGEPAHASAGAMRLLLLAGEGLMTGLQRARPLHHPVLERLAGTAGPHCETVDSAWGRFVFRARPLQACDAGARASWLEVQIERLEPRLLADERRVRRLDLAPAQAAVCRLLLAGHSQGAIAQQLGVAPSTVVDHTRRLYARLGVRSLRELAEAVRGA